MRRRKRRSQQIHPKWKTDKPAVLLLVSLFEEA